MGACEVPWALAGSDAYIVRSCEPLDVPIQSIQHQMLGCQLTHNVLNLTAHTWPRSDQLGSCNPCVPHAQSLKKTGLGIIRSDKYKFVSNFNVDAVNTAKIRLYSVKFKSELVK